MAYQLGRPNEGDAVFAEIWSASGLGAHCKGWQARSESCFQRASYRLPASRWIENCNGRAVDIHGEPIGTEYQESYFKGVATDTADPPLFVPQAA